MNSQILGLKVAGVIFGLMCLAQLLRLVIRPAVLVAGHHVPVCRAHPATPRRPLLARRVEGDWLRHGGTLPDRLHHA